jgi:pyruvate formate lyase activating enzyme
MGAAEVLAAVGKDAVFQNRSGGGLTVTGGEPLSQGDFLIDLLSAAKRARVSAAMETSGHGPYEVLSQAAGRLDLLFYDLKSLDPEKHRDFTGTGPSRILENLEAVCRDHPGLPIVVRTPVVPGFNDDLGSAMAIGRFLRRIPRVSHESLPYHALGGQKYGYLGRSYPMGEAGLAEGELARFKLAVERARYPDAAAGDGLAHKTAEFEK